MARIKIIVKGDGVWPDLEHKEVIHLGNDHEIQISALSKGMTSGNPSVAFRLDLPDGRVVLAETSMRQLITTSRLLEAKYKDEIDWG